jgi:hypothetical protein
MVATEDTHKFLPRDWKERIRERTGAFLNLFHYCDTIPSAIGGWLGEFDQQPKGFCRNPTQRQIALWHVNV